ncbi:efflux transporter outer membrane subunit [Serratia marcescens]|uniref:efflux transporter outer membrane subunit n=1 Tax=Serratia marcescens TaxID=615 RepID=UPI001BD20DEF|nr:efflux transporter outer membrane subunit [Serratia marcescens]
MNRAVIPLLLIALSGCRALGPDYARPQNALPNNWGEQAGGGALPVAWWSIFNDAPLSQLVQRAAAGNLDLQLATARMQQSRALLGVTEAALMPDLSLDGAYQRLRATQQQLTVAQENRATALRTLQLTQSRYQSGAGNELDIDQAQVQLAQVDALLPTLVDRQERLINAISLLLGERPGALKAMLSPTGPLPTLARAVPMGVPSDLALRRPDIREAAARLHQATAEIGVATADYYPRITLTGNAGYQALALADMGSWSTHTFAIGPTLYLPLFDGGKITQRVRLSEYRQQEMAIAYQQTVLRAWHEIDDALSGYRAQQRRQTHLAEALAANRHAFALARDSYLNGASDFIHVLSTQRALLDLQSAQIVSQEETAIAVVNIYRALGGGWEHTYPSAAPQEKDDAQHAE